MPHNVVCKEENLKLMKENPCPPCPCSDAAIIQGIDGCLYPCWRTRERVQPRLLPDSVASGSDRADALLFSFIISDIP